MSPPTLLATSDPLAATDSYNLLEDSFAAAFLRNSRPRSTTTPLSPRLPFHYPSPRLPSALPPSASPRMVEPLTPDKQQPVLPYFSDFDTPDFPFSSSYKPNNPASKNPTPRPPDSPREQAYAAERARRIEWTRAQPSLPSISSNSVGVVDEESADRMFSAARRASRPPIMMFSAPEPARLREGAVSAPNEPRHPAMKLELAPLRSGTGGLTGMVGAPVLSPSAWGFSSPKGLSPLGFGRDILGGGFGTQKRAGGDHWTAPVLGNTEGGFGSSSSMSGGEEGKKGSGGGGGGLVGGSGAEREESSGRMEIVGEAMGGRGVGLTKPVVPTGAVVSGGARRRGRRMIRPVNGDPLRCDVCGQRFARRSNLFKHLRSVHEEERKFACTACPHKFKRQDHLLKHTRSVHYKMRKFNCEICGIGFAEKFNRDKHTKSIHFTKRAFQCECGAYFQDREKMLGCLRCKRPSRF